MPMVGSVEAPFFRGKNVTEFLDRFEDLCVDYKVAASQKVARVIRYYLPSIRYYLSRHGTAMNQRCSESNGLPKDEDTKLKKRGNFS